MTGEMVPNPGGSQSGIDPDKQDSQTWANVIGEFAICGHFIRLMLASEAD
jgi:hypothetical protein